MTPQEAFRVRLREAMELRGLSQAALGRAIGTTQSVVQRYVSGEVIPAGEQMMRLPEALGISGHWLLTGQGPITPPGTAESEVYERGRAAGWAEAVDALRLAQAATESGEVPAEILTLARRLIEAESNPAIGQPPAQTPGDAGRG